MIHRNGQAIIDADDARLPPHSAESEAAIIGCILLDPDAATQACLSAGLTAEWFYTPGPRILWGVVLELRDGFEAVDTLTVFEALRTRNQIEEVGGLAYLSSLPDLVPSAANVGHYLDVVRDKFLVRRLVQTMSRATATAFDHAGEVGELFGSLRNELEPILSARIPGAVGQFLTVDELAAFDTLHDPDTLLGYRERDKTTTRYLCRCGSGWIIGPSGVGKSSLAAQMAILWACGKPAFGITPPRPLRITLIQAENDRGDLAEMVQGVLGGLEIGDLGELIRDDPDLMPLVRQNFRVRSESRRTGAAFAHWLAQVCREDRCDIVILDPFLSFAGIDVSKQAECTAFLRGCLNPVLHSTGVAILGMHHTGKPPGQKPNQRPATPLEEAYAGLGSSELVNWARLVIRLREVEGNNFELVLAKRGPRAGATHPDGQPTTAIWLRHAKGRICWEQIPPPEVPEQEGQDQKEPPTGRPSKVDSLMRLGLGWIVDSIKEPIGLRQLCRMIEDYAAAKRMDVKKTTCERAVEKLVANGLLLKTPDGYKKA